MKAKTKNGFEINVDDRKVKDWEYVEAVLDIETAAENNDQLNMIRGIRFAAPKLLGEKGVKALKDYLRKDDVVDTEEYITTFFEIIRLLGDKVKKSESSSST